MTDRRLPRLTVHAPIRLSGGGTSSGIVANISPGGCRVEQRETPIPVETDSNLAVGLTFLSGNRRSSPTPQCVGPKTMCSVSNLCFTPGTTSAVCIRRLLVCPQIILPAISRASPVSTKIGVVPGFRLVYVCLCL